MTGFAPTAQQVAIVDAAQRGESFNVAARAGSGKTATSLLLAKALIEKNPSIKILYVAFNKSTQLEAAAKFPVQVTAKTTHSLAYSVGAKMKSRMTRPMGTAQRVQMWQAAKQLGVRDVELSGVALDATTVTRLASQAVSKFAKSGDFTLTPYHVNRENGLEEVHDELCAAVLPVARQIWDDITGKTSGRVMNVGGEHYIKIWSLGQPRLAYDVIIYDEAQDANGAMYNVIMNAHKNGAQVIFVGDPEQSINGWNGAVNVITLNGFKTYALSKSFRFGQVVASQGNIFLSALDVPAETLMVGFEAINSAKGSVENPDAVLCRTNGGVIQVAMAELSRGKKVGIVGGGKNLRDLAVGAAQLKGGSRTSGNDFAIFKNWEEVLEYVKHPEGADLLPAVTIIEAQGTEAVIAAMDSLVDVKYAEVTVSTGHKAKGLEWKSVRIHSDFLPKPDKAGEIKIPGRAGLMLLYVAVTRAQHNLDDTALAPLYDKLAA